MPLQTHAAAAKAGVDAIMAGAALEFGPFGVTSNVITPGPSKCCFHNAPSERKKFWKA